MVGHVMQVWRGAGRQHIGAGDLEGEHRAFARLQEYYTEMSNKFLRERVGCKKFV